MDFFKDYQGTFFTMDLTKLKKTTKKKNNFVKSVSKCFEPSQPLGVVSGLKTRSKPSLTYSARRSPYINQNFSTISIIIK